MLGNLRESFYDLKITKFDRNKLAEPTLIDVWEAYDTFVLEPRLNGEEAIPKLYFSKHPPYRPKTKSGIKKNIKC